MKKESKAPAGQIADLPFHCLRNISSPEDSSEGRAVYAGQVPITAINHLPTNENVRNYLVTAEGKRRRAYTNVHRAIKHTLQETPDIFSVLNGGLVLVASKSEVFEKEKILRLTNPSIINGSQTQGVILDYLGAGEPDSPVHIKFELIITEDPNLIAEVSISRNFQNDVQSISIAGRRGQLDELETAIQKARPRDRLQKSETQRPSDDTNYLETEKILQVIAALLPAELWWKQSEASKVYTYSQKATCLKDFTEIYDRARSDEPADLHFRDIYRYYLDIAPHAIVFYDLWKSHQGFMGTRIRAIERDEEGVILRIPDGIVFPIIAAYSEFVVRTGSGWRITIPSQLADKEMITSALNVYQEIANSRPEIMGKNKACYTALQQITSIYKRLLTQA